MFTHHFGPLPDTLQAVASNFPPFSIFISQIIHTYHPSSSYVTGRSRPAPVIFVHIFTLHSVISINPAIPSVTLELGTSAQPYPTSVTYSRLAILKSVRIYLPLCSNWRVGGSEPIRTLFEFRNPYRKMDHPAEKYAGNKIIFPQKFISESVVF